MNKKILSVKAQPYKVVLLGGSMVGKSCFLCRYVDDIYQENYISTIGMDYKLKNLQLDNGETIKLQIWDTPGQDRFLSIVKNLFKGTHGFILIYNITRKNSLQFLRKLMKMIKDGASENVPIIVVGNIADDEGNRKITKEEGENFAIEFNLPFFECSGKENKNIKEIFDLLGKKIFEIYEEPKIKLENEKLKNKKCA